MVIKLSKKILITAGPTWVPIDNVRVISNIATGQTGILLAREARKAGAKVTLLLGPGINECCLDKSIKIIRFQFFDELKDKLIKELRLKKYDIVIHSAAVADYKVAKFYSYKVKSGIKNWRLKLIPTEKIIDLIKKINRSPFLVGFKFEPVARKKILIDKTRGLINRAKLDLVVANTIDKSKYRAYIIDNCKQIYGPIFNKRKLADKLIYLIAGNLCKD